MVPTIMSSEAHEECKQKINCRYARPADPKTLTAAAAKSGYTLCKTPAQSKRKQPSPSDHEGDSVARTKKVGTMRKKAKTIKDENGDGAINIKETVERSDPTPIAPMSTSSHNSDVEILDVSKVKKSTGQANLSSTLATGSTEGKPAGHLVPGPGASETTSGQGEDVSRKPAMPPLQESELNKAVDSFIQRPDQVSTLLPMLDVQLQTQYSNEVKKLWAFIDQHPKGSNNYRLAEARHATLTREISNSVSSANLKSGAAGASDMITKPISQDDLGRSLKAPVSAQVSQKPVLPTETVIAHTSYLLTALEQKWAAKKDDTISSKDQIAIILDEQKSLILIDKAHLVAASNWFDTQCANASEHDSFSASTKQKYGTVKYLFVLADEEAGLEVLGLMRVPLDYDIETYLKRFQKTMQIPAPLKQEGGDPMEIDHKTAQNGSQEAFTTTEVYVAMLQFLKLSPSGVVKCVTQSGTRSALIWQVVSLGRRLGALATLHTSMSTFFYKMAQRLWTAIASDPPLWLSLAVVLNEADIYKEAAIHLIGCQLQWHPNWTVSKSRIPANVLVKLERKADKLMLEIFKVIHGLHQSSVTKPTKAKAANSTLNNNAPNGERVSPAFGKHAWIIVNIFHDFWITQCSVLDNGRGDYNMHGIAHILRQIERGGEAYLPTQSVLDLVYNNFPNNKEDILNVLTELKRFAGELVRPLLVNELQYKGPRLDYLTCVEVGKDDIPFEVEDVEETEF